MSFPKRRWACGLAALIAAGSSGCSTFRHVTVMTSSPAVSVGNPPSIGDESTRKQINKFVAYFTSKGFPVTDLRADYSPSGRVKHFHYHAIHQRSTVTADINAAAHTSSTSVTESDSSTTTRSYGTP